MNKLREKLFDDRCMKALDLEIRAKYKLKLCSIFGIVLLTT